MMLSIGSNFQEIVIFYLTKSKCKTMHCGYFECFVDSVQQNGAVFQKKFHSTILWIVDIQWWTYLDDWSVLVWFESSWYNIHWDSDDPLVAQIHEIPIQLSRSEDSTMQHQFLEIKKWLWKKKTNTFYVHKLPIISALSGSRFAQQVASKSKHTK